ncbi:MAG: response regulator transcription factor [Deltaproteobacteria bacterium]|nr:response regulator transcription factor [Deltaproteobacteria bacterium]
MTPGRNPLRVLLVEDDERLAQLTAEYFESHGIEVTRAGDGNEAIAAAARFAFDVVILDLMLPGKDGIEVCRELRRRHAMPIVMLTARGDEVDRVIGLDAGADDYVTKPFSARELLARVHAQGRRTRGEVGPRGEREIRAGRVRLNPQSLTALVDDQPVALSPREFALLRVLVESAGRILSREQLLALATGSTEDAFDRAIDVQVSRLRAKLGDDGRHPRMLKTIRGVGYMFAVDDLP